MKPLAGTISLILAAAFATSVVAQPAGGDRVARVVTAAIEQTRHEVRYDPGYVRISYPGGDVPPDRGVCADVIVRAWRAIGIDLQKEVHEDMTAHFAAYPKTWGLAKPDTNIDHRRVPNLRTYFSRVGASLGVSGEARDYHPGDIVTWNLTGVGVPHIGVVTDRRSSDGQRPLVVHNIGAGPKLEDVLFSWKVTGHYRYPAQDNGSRGGSR